MENNNLLTIDITDLGENGEGIGRHEGMAVFVPGALPGERITARIKTQKKNYAHGRLVEILTPSPDRVNPPCEIAGQCGGCQIQSMNYQAQLKWKESQVRACMDRIAKLPEVVISPIIGMEDPWHYRNKVLYPAGGSPGKPELGFYKLGSHQVVSGKGCLIQHPFNAEVLEAVKELMELHGIQPYSEQTHTGHIRHILLRNSLKGEWLMVWVTSGKSMPRSQAVAADLKAKFPQIVTMLVNRNAHKDHRMLGDRTDILYGAGYLEDSINNLTFRISPESFFQVNPIQTKVLYEKALELAGLQGHETVLDLYCGIGAISLFLAPSAGKVIGVEVVQEAVKDAQENAALNSISNVEYIHGAGEVVLPELVKQGIRPDVVLVDPPRKGCERPVLDAIMEMAPDRVVYVSCKPSTLARDLAILTEGGYTVKTVQPVDQFPHSVHVETVVLLVRK